MAIRRPAQPDDIARLEAEGREDFFMAVDGAFHLLHGRDIARLRGLMAQMDRLARVGTEHADQAELVVCWRDMRLVLSLIDIEAEDT